MPLSHPDKDSIRRMMRTRRKELARVALVRREKQLCRQLAALPVIRHSRHIAGYWPNEGEISPIAALQHLIQEGKQVYLPRLTKDKRLVFGDWSGDRALRPNRFGIPEPAHRRFVAPRRLDVVLMPLVAFDKAGNRLGMGGGYYDRSFAFRRHSWMRKPLLVGIAHDFQQLGQLPSESWDIPLDMIVTNSRVIRT